MDDQSLQTFDAGVFNSTDWNPGDYLMGAYFSCLSADEERSRPMYMQVCELYINIDISTFEILTLSLYYCSLPQCLSVSSNAPESS